MRYIVLAIPTATPDEEVIAILDDLQVQVDLGLYKSFRLEADDPAEIEQISSEGRRSR